MATLTRCPGCAFNKSKKMKKQRYQMVPRILTLGLLSGLFFTGTQQVVRAQIGTGWHEFFPSSVIQTESSGVYNNFSGSTTSISYKGVRYSDSSGIETYQLVSTDSNRVERRYHDDYTSGHRQFQADIKISSPSSGETVHQIFNGSAGPYILMREHSSNNGNIEVLGKTGAIASNLYGVYFRLNTINSFSSGNTYVYINGTLKWTGTHPSGSFYTKYGCYGTLGASSAKIQFKNVHMYQ